MAIRRKTLLKIVLIPLAIVAALAYFVVEIVLPYSGIKPFRVDAAALPEFKNGILPSDYGLDFAPFDIQTKDSLILRGYLIKAEKPRATIILVHGIADCKEHFYPFCQKLKEIGCQTLIFDLRAHGKSGGMYCTFGYFEKNDIAIVIDSLKKKNVQQPFGIFGNSLGGAIALQALGNNKNLKFGIIESTFDEFPKVSLEYGEDFIGIRSVWLTNHVIKKSGDIAHFNPFDIKPDVACGNITCPIFMAHGVLDDKIPIAFGEHNFNSLKTADKQFIRVQGAGHDDLHQKGGVGYWEKMKAFILQQSSKGLKPLEDLDVGDLDDRLITLVHNLPIVQKREAMVIKATKGKRHLTYYTEEDPSKPNAYIVVVAEDNGMSYHTHFRFYLDKKSFKGLNPDGQPIY